jgi:radical SAM protein with 4Fe4S-binding SPASM domain
VRVRLCLCRMRLRLRRRWQIENRRQNPMSILDSFGKISHKVFPRPVEPPKPGLFHFVHENGQEKSRIHLRIDQDGSGVLVVNANRILHLNPTAAWMAYEHLNEIPGAQTLAHLASAYLVEKTQLQKDYDLISFQVDELVRPDGACPIHELDLETRLPFSANPSAPYRMDLAVTYRCNNDCAHCYNGRTRTYPERSTGDWKLILDKLWDLAVPHVVFTGGEPTLRNDLAELVGYAEKKGMISGLNTNGRRISDKAYLQTLIDAGLDHVQITLESHDAGIHDEMVHSNGAWKQTVQGIRNAIDSRLYVMTNTTMLQINSPYLHETLEFLAELKVPTIGLNSLIYSGRGVDVGTGLHEDQLVGLLDLAKAHTEKTGQKLIWYTPTEYCHFDPVIHELGVKGCTAAYYNMCVEPDGSVIPCQSYYNSLGNLLTDSWDSIWNHPLSKSLRSRKDIPAKCGDCALLVECGGGCPLHRVDEIDPAILAGVS